MKHICPRHNQFVLHTPSKRQHHQFPIGMAAQIEIDDGYGIKMEMLVKGFTPHIQNLLITKISTWCSNSNLSFEDFIALNPHKKNLTKQEKALIQAGDVKRWDAPLCRKWLKSFPWSPHVEPLNLTEIQSLDKLLDLRNNQAHSPSFGLISESSFNEACGITFYALLSLGVGFDEITQLIKSAKDKVIVGSEGFQKKIAELEETTWNYEVTDVLGVGSFGIVLKAIHKLDKKESAIKLIPCTQHSHVLDDPKILREVESFAQLEHKNVVKYRSTDIFKFSPKKLEEVLKNTDLLNQNIEFLDACIFRASRSSSFITGLLIQTEVCGENLRQWLDNQASNSELANTEVENKTAIRICTDIGNGIMYIHGQKYLHRDIRPPNLFFARHGYQFPVKIGDFGLSNQGKIDQAQTQSKEIGNHLYRAPEIDAPHPDPQKSDKAKYNGKVDLWSFGLVIAEVFHPENEDQLRRKFNNIIHKRDVGDKIKELPWIVENLILALTEDNPDNRPELPHGKEMFYWGDNEMWSRNAPKHNYDPLPVFKYQATKTQSPIVNPPLVEEFTSMNLRAASGNVNRNPSPEFHRGETNSENSLAIYLPSASNNEQSLRAYGNITTIGAPLHRDKILIVRKTLQANKGFWNSPEALAMFFRLIDNKEHMPAEFAGSARTVFNSKLYKIQENLTQRFTKQILQEALRLCGYPELSDKLENVL